MAALLRPTAVLIPPFPLIPLVPNIMSFATPIAPHNLHSSSGSPSFLGIDAKHRLLCVSLSFLTGLCFGFCLGAQFLNSVPATHKPTQTKRTRRSLALFFSFPLFCFVCLLVCLFVARAFFFLRLRVSAVATRKTTTTNKAVNQISPILLLLLLFFFFFSFSLFFSFFLFLPFASCLFCT